MYIINYIENKERTRTKKIYASFNILEIEKLQTDFPFPSVFIYN